MNESDMKNKIKQSFDIYEIKTTSQQILNAYHDQKISSPEPTKKFNLFSLFAPILTLSAASLIAIFVLPNININPSINPSISSGIDDTQVEYKQANSKQNQISFSVFSGMNIIANFDDKLSSIEKLSNLKMSNQDINEKPGSGPNDDHGYGDREDYENLNDNITFSEIVDVFDPCVDVVNSLFQKSINVESVINEGSFVGNYGTYPYCLEVYDYKLYTNITFSEEDDESETTYIGEIYINETTSYKVELSIEEEYSVSLAMEENIANRPGDNDMEGDKKPDEDHPFDDEKPDEPPMNDEDKLSFEDDGIDVEVEMEIYYDESSYLEIEQSIENDERTYTYTLYENDEEIYQENVSFDNRRKRNDSCIVEILKDGKVYEYDNIKPTKDGLECEYRANRKSENNRFNLIFEGNKRIYTNHKFERIEKI